MHDRLCDRRRRGLHRGVGHHGRNADALHARTRRDSHVHHQPHRGTRTAGNGLRRQFDVGGTGSAARIRPAGRRRHPERYALLQQALAGGLVPAFPHRVRALAAAGDPLQHPGTLGRQHDGRDDAATGSRDEERDRHQGGIGRHRTDAAHPRPAPRRVHRAVATTA